MVYKMKFKKPVIGVTTNLLKITEQPLLNHERIYVNQGYINSIIQSGGIPFMLPVTHDVETMNRLLDLVDGVLFSGGQDIHPSYYKEHAHPLLEITSAERDVYEMQLIQLAQKSRKPILGICRGLQLINVFFGGTLYQDLSQFSDQSKEIHSKKSMEAPLHTVELMTNRRLSQIFGKNKILTNSFHHQAVKDLAPGFAVSALAEDGVIEGIESLDSHWIMGVQWHPEVRLDSHPTMENLFNAFISEASAHRGLG